MPSVPVPGYAYPSGHEHIAVHRVIMCLEDWFNAIQSGTATYRYPAHDYPKTWTDDQLAAIIAGIDAAIDQEVVRTPGTQPLVKAQAGPGFLRLAPLQRLALVQDLHRIITEEGVPAPKPVGWGVF